MRSFRHFLKPQNSVQVKYFLNTVIPFSPCSTTAATTTTTDSEMDLNKVLKALESFAPKSLAEDWDNVGLLIEPSNPKIVHKIALTNDLTSEVMQECVEKKADLIISYHPPIFRPMKKLTLGNWKEKIVITCIKNDIALYSPHTSFDAVANGVNDWLISPYGSGEKVPIQPSKSFDNGNTHQVFFTVDGAMADLAKSVLTCIKGITTTRNGNDFTLACPERTLPSVLTILGERQDMFNDLRITKLEKHPIPGTGMGRKLKLDTPISLRDAVEKTKAHVGLQNLRLALGLGKTLDSKVTTVAVCAGSGASVLAGVNADLFVSGEMSHHEVLDLVHAGGSVILCEHSNSERGFLGQFAKVLKPLLDERVEIFVSQTDKDSLVVV